MPATNFTRPEDYIFASTRIRMYGKRLLSDQTAAQFQQASSYEEALKILRESPYGNRLDAGDMTYEASLAREAERLRLELNELVPGSPLLRLISLDDLYHNLKVLSKMVLLEQKMSDLLIPVEIANLTWLENLLREPEQNRPESPEEETLAEVVADYEQYKDPERLEFIIDRGLYRDKLAVAQALGSPLILGWLEEQIDFLNLTIFLRMRRVHKRLDWLELALLEGGKLDRSLLFEAYRAERLPSEDELASAGATPALIKAWQATLEEERIARMEKARDERSLALAEEAKRFTYGPEVLFGYYISRSIEIQNLRTLMLALRNGMPADERRKHLRLKP